MSARIAAMQDQLQLGQVSKIIRKLTDKPFKQLDLSFMRDKTGKFLEKPRHVHAALISHFREWHASPSELDPAAQALHLDPHFLDSLMALSAPTLLHPDSTIPHDLQKQLIASLRRPLPPGVTEQMTEAICSPVSYSSFVSAIQCQPSGKAPGPSGLTANMLKSWPESLLRLAHSLIQTLWSRGVVPGWWGDRLLCLAPKASAEFTLDNLRPISLFEVLRKTWLGIICRRISAIWDAHSLLAPSQHGFRNHRGTETALLRLIALLESAEPHELFHFTFWDIKRAFDSVARLLKRLAWYRMGARGRPLNLIMSLDEIGRAFPWSPHMMHRIHHQNTSPYKKAAHLIKNSSALGFLPERGIGQGDTLSTFTWNAVFDILLHLLTVHDLAYADDLSSISSVRGEHMHKMDLVSAYCSFTGLSPAIHKIQSILVSSGIIPELLPLTIRNSSWSPVLPDMSLPLDSKYLGVCLPLQTGPVINDPACKAEERRLHSLLARIMTKHASPGGMILLITLQIIPRVIYRASRASWSLAQCFRFDRILSMAYRKILSLGSTFPEALLYLPKTMHGMGLRRFSDSVQIQKWNMFHRLASLGDTHLEAASSLFTNMANGLAVTPPPHYYLSSLAKWLEAIDIVPAPPRPPPSLHLPQYLAPIAPAIRCFPLHAIFTDGSLVNSGDTVRSITTSNFDKKNTSLGAAAIVLMADRNSWRRVPPIVFRIAVTACRFPGINAYVMEVAGSTLCPLSSPNPPHPPDLHRLSIGN
jgi:hypothetical protein